MSSPAPTADGENRRRSGRVVKKPKIYADSVPSTPKTKRKRPEKEPEEDVDEDAEENAAEESGDDAEDSDAHASRPQARKSRATKKTSKKPAQKKPKTNGDTTNLAIRSAAGKAQSRKRPVARVLKNTTVEEDKGIYGELFVHGKPVEEITAAWLKRFGEDEALALAEVVNFVLRCAGCGSEVDIHDIKDPDSCTSKLSDFQDEYQAQNITEYPLIAARSRSTTIKNGIVDFFKTLVASIGATSLIFTNVELMENIEVWISTMTSAANRPFRHTATVVSLAIVSGLAEFGKAMMDSSSRTIRQSETERKKGRVNKSRVSDMDKQVKKAHQQQEALDGLIKDWFDTVFVHRYRDVDTKIRGDCVEALGEWILTYPELFFDGQHLRYLGWVLSDIVASTRLEVVRQLQRLYRDKNKIGGLKNFTERFRPRLVEMATRDADMNVRINSVELLDTLREAGLLEPDDIDAVGKLIFDTEPRVRKAVVPFFVETINGLFESKIEDLGGDELLRDTFPQSSVEEGFATPQVEWLKLKALVEMLEAYDADSEELMGNIEHGSKLSSYIIVAAGWESRFSLAAQALYESMDDLRTWPLIAGYLLYDSSAPRQNGAADDTETQFLDETKLSESEELILLELLLAIVETEAGETYKALHDRKRGYTRDQREQMIESQEEDARRLSVFVPQLLKKFGSSPEAVSVTLRLEHVLNLDVFQELRQDSTVYSALLDDINNQFLTHGSANVLREASVALLHAKSYDELAEVTEGKLQALWDDTIAAIHTLKRGKDLTKRGGFSNNARHALSNTVLRIANLASISNCIQPLESLPIVSKRAKPQKADEVNAISALLDIIYRAAPSEGEDLDTDSVENDIVSNACRSILFYFMWQRKELEQAVLSDTQISSNDVRTLVDIRDTAVIAGTEVLSQRKGADDIRLQMAGFLLELHTVLATVRDIKPSRADSATSNASRQALQILAQEIPAETIKSLESVLTAAEKHFAKKSNRTLEKKTSASAAAATTAGGAASGPNHDVAVDDDPIGSDSESDSESDPDDEDDEDDTEAAAANSDEARQHASLVAEQALCELASKIVLAIAARVLDAKGTAVPGSMTRRLQRNKTKLGPNFRDVATFLERKKAGSAKANKAALDKKRAEEAAAKAKAKGAAAAEKEVAAAENGEEEEADQNGEVGDEDDDGEDALRARGLVEEGDGEGEEDEAMEDAAAGGSEIESVAGD